MKSDNPKNYLYFMFSPKFLEKKLTLEELFHNKKRLPRYDRANVHMLENYWRRINIGTYVLTPILCVHYLVNTDVMVRYGPSFGLARVMALAVACIVGSDVGKIALLYDSNKEYLLDLMKRHGFETYNPYAPE